MPSFVQALYDFAGDTSSNTPPFCKGEIMVFIKQHPNGWVEVEKKDGTHGYVSPSWVKEIAASEPDTVENPNKDQQQASSGALAVANRSEDQSVQSQSTIQPRALQIKSERMQKPAPPVRRSALLVTPAIDPQLMVRHSVFETTPSSDITVTYPQQPMLVTDTCKDGDNGTTQSGDDVQGEAAIDIKHNAADCLQLSGCANVKADQSQELSSSEQVAAKREEETTSPAHMTLLSQENDELPKQRKTFASEASSKSQQHKLPVPTPRPKPTHHRQRSQPENFEKDSNATTTSQQKAQRKSMYSAFQQQLEATLSLGAQPRRQKSQSVVIEGMIHIMSLPPITQQFYSTTLQGDTLEDGRTVHVPESQRMVLPSSPANIPSEEINEPSILPHASENDTQIEQVEDRHQSQEESQSPKKQELQDEPSHLQQSQQTQIHQQAKSTALEQSPSTTIQHDGAAIYSQQSSIEGYLERKLVRESGREARRRQWQKFYAALDGGYLVLFGNKKDLEKHKKPVSVIDISRFVIMIDDEYIKRDYVFTLEDSQDKILFQAASEVSMMDWVAELNRRKNYDRLSCDPGREDNEAAITKTMDNEGMLSSDQAALGITELDSSKGYARRKLNKYLRSRPKKQELLSKGIIEYPVFGGTLSHQAQVEKQTTQVPLVPVVVIKCIHRVEKSITEQGIYRVPGNVAQIQHLVAEANDDCNSLNIDSVQDVHAAAGLLKLYFRELADPAFTEEKYPDFISAGKIQDQARRHLMIKELFASLPEANRATLIYLFQHLRRVGEHGSKNKMHLNNLAIVFGPTLLRASQANLDSIVMDAPYQSSVVEDLIRYPELCS